MTSLHSLLGMKVVARDTAERVGEIHGVVVDIHRGTVLAWQVGKGRKARVIDHAHVTGIADAAVIDAEDSLREPADGLETDTLKGRGALLGSLVLTDAGVELGSVDDVEVDTDSGALGVVSTGGAAVEPSRLLGLGSYALVVAAD